MRIAVITAGLSEPSSTRLLADRLLAATTAALTEDEDAPSPESDLVDLRVLAHDVTDTLLTRVASEPLGAAIRAVQDADAVIAVTPTFSMSYSGLFKSFVDLIDEGALVGVPVLLGATGGTPRHSMVLEAALRPLFGYLQALTAPTAVFAAAEDWGHQGLDARIRRAGREFAELVQGVPRRRRPEAYDPEGGAFVEFDRLLAR